MHVSIVESLKFTEKVTISLNFVEGVAVVVFDNNLGYKLSILTVPRLPFDWSNVKVSHKNMSPKNDLSGHSYNYRLCIELLFS